ncbi:hypothetical protein, partial [Microbacterium sp. NPDC086615]|uniref:hypothetical protein n=1 Tax=Microbacterium sp. NPDC086615 TaxID=3154865 RepID=UPI0034489832
MIDSLSGSSCGGVSGADSAGRYGGAVGVWVVPDAAAPVRWHRVPSCGVDDRLAVRVVVWRRVGCGLRRTVRR